jgi:ribosomal protein L16 Arg81 hydroxylase
MHQQQQQHSRCDLQQILGERTTVDAFLRDVWGKRSLFIKGTSKKKFAGVYSVEKWREHLAKGADEYTITSQDPHGQEKDVLANRADALLAAGHTLCGKITSSSSSPGVAAFLQIFNLQVGGIGAPSASIYESSHGGGFVTHWDRFHVLILQLDGSKIWSYGETPEVRAPRDNFAVGDGAVYIDDVDGRQITGPDISTLVTTRLDPGDCLYLPPGTWHRGMACGHSVAISISPGQDSIGAVLAHLIERALVQESVDYRMGFLGSRADRDGGVPADVSSHLAAALGNLKRAAFGLTLADLQREWSSQVERGVARLDVGVSARKKGTLTKSSRLERVRARPIRYVRAPKRFGEKENHLIVQSGDLELALPLFAEALLRELIDHPSFIAEDAVGWDPKATWEEVAPFLEALVNLGLLAKTATSSSDLGSGVGDSSRHQSL